jgi:bidirectional [NiFe] hydrogenase diaphorase subunit
MDNEHTATVTVEIDGNKVTAPYGARLLDVCAGQGIGIPTLCYHPSLPGYAACRLCVVELHRGERSKLVASCEYPLIKEGERFSTGSAKVWDSRLTSAGLLVARAPDAREALEKILGRPIDSAGRYAPASAENRKCVLCGLCYRLCQAQGTAAISATGRGANKIVATPYREANDACIGCGSCAAICPTGAIEMREPPGKRAIWRQLFDLEKCPRCGKPFMTARMARFIKEHTDQPDEIFRLCPDCRRKRLGKSLVWGTLWSMEDHR